jgi:Acetyltransferase (GNAT) domain
MITLALSICCGRMGNFCVETVQPLSQVSSVRLGEIQLDNAAEMRELFERVFGKPMSEPFWRWKYLNGNGHALGVWQGDVLVAHYGGIGADIVMDGQAKRAVQIVDVMVDPAVRSAVRRTSPFFLATSSFLERFIGFSQPYLLGYGFPSHRHLQLAAHLRLYAAVGAMSELHFPTAPPVTLRDALYQWKALPAPAFAAQAAEFDQLWQRMQQSLPAAIIVRKDAARIRHRYLDHPEHAYQLWVLRHRLTGTAVATVVLKVEAARVLLMDVVGPLPVLARVLRLTARLAWQHWQLPLTLWLSTAQVEKLQLPAQHLQVNALPISTPANIWTAGPPPAELQDRWWLMAGDTDFL